MTIEEMSLNNILKRAPAVAIVDELAHTNVPGSCAWLARVAPSICTSCRWRRIRAP
jgi:hypothetical protein